MKRLKCTHAILFICMAIVSANYLNAQDKYAELKAEFRKKIEKSMRKKDIAGASLILIDGDSIIWEEYFGYADKEEEIKVTENTLFKIGSVSKLITGTSIMMHVQNGKLDLDKPVKNYLPGFKIKQRFDNVPPITSRMLLTHHAGLPSDIMRGFESDSAEHYTKELELLNNEYAIFPPNMIHAYSNPGFNLLGILAGELAGTSYMEYIRNDIFKPLNMPHSRFWGYDPDPQHLSQDYTRKGKPIHEAYIREIPAGGILSNVNDLSEFVKEWLPSNKQEKVLKKTYRQQMLTIQNENMPLDMNQEIGLVWFVDKNTKAGTIYKHGGATFYHRAMLAIAPETDLGVVMLTNSENGNSVNRYYDDILKKAAEIKGVAKETKKEDKPEYAKKKIDMSDKTAGEYTGYYAFPGGLYKIHTKNGKLRTEIQNLKLGMIPVEKNMFIPKLRLLGPLGIKLRSVRFSITEIDGKQIVIQEQTGSGRKDIIGVKIEPYKISQAWKNRIGKYEIVNNKPGDFIMFDDFELKTQDGFLILASTLQFEPKQQLEPALILISDELAYVAGLGRQGGYSVQVIRDKDGKEYLYYSGFKLRKKE